MACIKLFHMKVPTHLTFYDANDINICLNSVWNDSTIKVFRPPWPRQNHRIMKCGGVGVCVSYFLKSYQENATVSCRT